MASGMLSKGITLGVKEGSGSTYTDLPDLMEIPELGATVEKVDVTTLKDANKRYINGVGDYGDLQFKFLYANGTSDSFRKLKALETAGKVNDYQITLPDGTKFAFSAQTSVKLDSTAVNGALTFTASLSLNSEMTITNPAD